MRLTRRGENVRTAIIVCACIAVVLLIGLIPAGWWM
jgi:hypothetical protein